LKAGEREGGNRIRRTNGGGVDIEDLDELDVAGRVGVDTHPEPVPA